MSVPVLSMSRVPAPDFSAAGWSAAGAEPEAPSEAAAAGLPSGKAVAKGPRTRAARVFFSVPATRLRATSSGWANWSVKDGTLPATALDSMSGRISRPSRVSTFRLPGSMKSREFSWAVAGEPAARLALVRESQTGMRATWPLPALTGVARAGSPTTCWAS